MSVTISEEIKKYLGDKETLKVLATTDENGDPHVVGKGSIRLDENDQLLYFEVLKGSVTNRNILSSREKGRKVAINLINRPDSKSFQLKGKVSKKPVEGEALEKYRAELKARNPAGDLAAVYFINVDEIIEESFAVRKKQLEN